MYLCYIITPRARDQPWIEAHGKRDREREREKMIVNGVWHDGENKSEKKVQLGEEKFFGVWPVGSRERAATRLMNRNNSRAIVLFGSFQLTAAVAASSQAADLESIREPDGAAQFSPR